MFLNSIPPCSLLLCIQELASNTSCISMLKNILAFYIEFRESCGFINNGKRLLLQTSHICVIHLNFGTEWYRKCCMPAGLNPFTFWSSVVMPLLTASTVPTKHPDKSLRICLQWELFQNSYSWLIVLNWIPRWIFIF